MKVYKLIAKDTMSDKIVKQAECFTTVDLIRTKKYFLRLLLVESESEYLLTGNFPTYEEIETILYQEFNLYFITEVSKI